MHKARPAVLACIQPYLPCCVRVAVRVCKQTGLRSEAGQIYSRPSKTYLGFGLRLAYAWDGRAHCASQHCASSHGC